MERLTSDRVAREAGQPELVGARLPAERPRWHAFVGGATRDWPKIRESSASLGLVNVLTLNLAPQCAYPSKRRLLWSARR